MGHWYKLEDNGPMHEIDGANGKTRATTLRDARKLGLVPSVTTVLAIEAAPGLERWKLNNLGMACYSNPPEEGEPVDSYLKRVNAIASELAAQAAETGTQIHDAIERAWNGDPVEAKWQKHADNVIALIKDKTGNSSFVAEAHIPTVYGYGGMVDLHNFGWVIDYKSKDITDVKKQMAYDNHCMQLSAYAHALGLHDARLVNVFVDRTDPDKIIWYEWDKNMYNDFELLLARWQSKNNYYPTTRKAA